ncbi:MAG: TIGR00730 family Rossman fold protein [Bullifex sp.]
MSRIKSAAVFCGSSFGNDCVYTDKAKELGRALAYSGIRLVYGGGYRGLMGTIAESVRNAGGRVTGVLPEFFDDPRVRMKSVEDELIITPGMHERKQAIYDKADAFIIFPGGIGTMDEFFEIFTWKQIGLHQKNIALYNVSGFFDTLLDFLQECTCKGFLKKEVLSSLIIRDDADELIKLLETKETVLPSKI